MKSFWVLFFVILGANQLSALGSLELVNSQTLDINLVKNLTISYSSDNIVLLESNDSSLVLKEFMTRSSPEYFAKIENSQDTININGGRRPWLIRTRIEIYIPKIYIDNLSVNLRSGNININSFQGEANIVNRSGNIVVNNFVGKGTFDVRSGNIDLTVNDIIGDIILSCNSGTIDLIMGRNISFILDAEVGSGTINAPNLRRQVNTKVQHNIGSDPIHKVFAKCGSGNINIE
jgi:DUF4097 and DUF4098 domain-containing protein YvlB